MKIVASLSRHRRLLALCGVSACVHLLVLGLVARRHAGLPSAPPFAAETLRLRLLAPGAAPTPVMPAPITDEVAPAAPVPQHAPARAPAASEHAAAAVAAAAPAPAAQPAAAVAAPAPAVQIPGAPLQQMPSRYRVRLPAPVRLVYTLVSQAPAQAQPQAQLLADEAHLDWRSDGERYVLDMDGVLGKLRSEGGSGDAGIAPRRASEAGDRAERVTQFDPDGRRIVFQTTGASVPDAVGAQDRASVLMQLAGIGLAEPDQVKDEIRIVVAGALHADIARFQVLGQETVATRLGSMTTWRIAQAAAPDEAHFELWLAPQQGWLPVQLRVTRPDGSVATQTLLRIEPGSTR